ncbi:MAG: hypothetical protein ACE5G3_12885 [Gammaproteobacteria bacterium]
MESRTATAMIATMMLAVILLVWARATQAALGVVEQAYEIELWMVERWPLGDAGSIVLRPCEECSSVVLRVSADTAYRRSGSAVNISREEMLRIKAMLGSDTGALVYVYYRPDDDTATRIVLDTDD